MADINPSRSPPPPPPPPPPLPLVYYFVAGGIGDVTAALISHPFDTIKVRQQLTGELSSGYKKQGIRALLHTASSIIKHEGFFGVYRGLSASVLRQSTFSTMRHGGFATACTIIASSSGQQEQRQQQGQKQEQDRDLSNNLLLPPHPSKNVSMWQAMLSGAFVGGVAAFLSNPSDVALIRMQSDAHWPKEQRRNYRNAFHAISSVIRQESVGTLWRGCVPTVLRAALCTTTQVPTYHWTKSTLLSQSNHWSFFSSSPLFPNGTDDIRLHVVASINSAAVATIVTCPVDVVKTRIINMQRGGTAQSASVRSVRPTPYYSGVWDCVVTTVRIEGVRGLFKGLVPTFVRLGPHTIVLWNVQEFVLRKLNRR